MEKVFTTIALFLLMGIAGTAQAEDISPTDPATIEEGHNWNKGRVVQKATCTTAGLKTYICLDDNCDATKEEVIEPLGHDFNKEFITDIYATCTTEGSKSKHCTRCEERDETTTIPANGHKWDDGETVKLSTCTEEGENIFHCIVYGCDGEKHEAIAPLGHNWDRGIITEHANCTQKGNRKRNCQNEGCSAIKNTSIPALGHNFESDFTIDVAATCHQSGSQSHHCTRCEERTDITLLPATGHTWGETTVIVAATCTSEGSGSITCKNPNCNETITQTISATGHQYGGEFTIDLAATCEKEGSKSQHCIHCGHAGEGIAIPALGHMAGDTTQEHIISPNCHNDGQYDKVCYCSYCQKELFRATIILPATEHNWDEGVCTISPTIHNVGKRVYTCMDCQITRYEIIDKIHESIALTKSNKGEYFRVSKEGICPGTETYVSYAIQSGVPTEYRIEFSEVAKEAGFESNDWQEVDPEMKIAISAPENCAAGSYTATVVFRDEEGEESDSMSFSFKVNLPSTLMVAIFEDVISIDNRGDRFTTYQWYHNDMKIEGATKAYYQEFGGLTGEYYVLLDAGTERESRTCPGSDWEVLTTPSETITLSPNPMEEEALVQINDAEEKSHTLTVINELGATLLIDTFRGNEYRLNCGKFASGKYIIHVDEKSINAIKK